MASSSGGDASAAAVLLPGRRAVSPGQRSARQRNVELAAQRRQMGALSTQARAAKSAYSKSLQELDRISAAVHEEREMLWSKQAESEANARDVFFDPSPRRGRAAAPRLGAGRAACGEAASLAPRSTGRRRGDAAVAARAASQPPEVSPEPEPRSRRLEKETPETIFCDSPFD